jgi:hypothetical protein
MHRPGTRVNEPATHLAAAHKSKNSTKNQSLGVVLPTRAYYCYAQIYAVGREK